MEKFELNRKNPWGSVPEALIEDRRLGHSAVRLGVWLCIRPSGWVVHKNHVCAVLGLGEKGWDSARRELERAGYLTRTLVRVGGKFTTPRYSFDPQPGQNSPEAPLPPPVKTGGGQTGGGKGAHITKTSLTKTIKQKQQPQQSQAVDNFCGGGGGIEEIEELQIPGELQDSRRQIENSLAGLGAEQRQQIVDELAGQLDKVKNPVGWVRKLAQRSRAGEELVFEHAQAIAHARAARLSAQARELAPALGPADPEARARGLAGARALLADLQAYGPNTMRR